MMQHGFSWIAEIYENSRKDRVASLAAALAYYTIFSIVPILLICISLTGTFFGEEAARGQIIGHISGLLGQQTALQIQEMIQKANHPAAFTAQVVSVCILLFTASGVFSEIQGGLNIIWGVQANPNQKWFAFIKNRFISFAMVLISAVLLLISIVLSTLLALLSSRINYFIGVNIFLELTISYFFSFLMITLLFAMIFKHLPDISLKWSDVWVGALITSLLFSIGKILIGFYLNLAPLASVFGAAGSLIVLLVWVYYSAQVFFIGAEITKIYSSKKGD